MWTEDVAGTVYQLSSLAIALIYLGSFAILPRSERDIVRILLAAAIAALMIGLFAIASFFLGVGSELKQGRTTGGTGDPNFFATYQVVVLPLVLVLAATVENRARRIGLYGVALVLVASVLTSLSRGGVLTLLAVLVLIVGVPARRLYRTPGQKALFLAVIAVSGAFALATTAKELIPRVEAIIINKQETTASGRGSGRVDLWLAARAAFVQHPYTGIGYGAFPAEAQQLLLTTPGVDLQVYSADQPGHEAHNAYLGTAAELGVPGLVLFLGMLASLAATLRATARDARRRGQEFLGRVATALVISLAGFVVSSIFLSTETSRVLWIIMGLSLALPRLVKSAETRQSP
jgi:O-antigen ligase